MKQDVFEVMFEYEACKWAILGKTIFVGFSTDRILIVDWKNIYCSFIKGGIIKWIQFDDKNIVICIFNTYLSNCYLARFVEICKFWCLKSCYSSILITDKQIWYILYHTSYLIDQLQTEIGI